MQTKLNFAQKPKQEKMQEEPIQAPVIKQSSILPWVEKYRPHRLDEISFQEDVTKSLEGVLQTGNLPHLMLYGPPGTGKTSCILALAKQLFGPDQKSRVMELNASDDRGIVVVREKIKKFAQQVVSKSTQSSAYLCPNYKIIILDEADSMTLEAQQALRRIIEDFSGQTRFCIICNYITKMIEPLSSRCLKFRFAPISEEAQLNKLEEISIKENLSYDRQALSKLIQVSNGDLRKSVNLLQSAASLFEKKISEINIMKISGIVPPEDINDLFSSTYQGDINLVIKAVQDILSKGYSPDIIIGQFADLILQTQLSDYYKALIIEEIAIVDKSLNENAEYEIQLLNLMMKTYKIVQKSII